MSKQKFVFKVKILDLVFEIILNSYLLYNLTRRYGHSKFKSIFHHIIDLLWMKNVYLPNFLVFEINFKALINKIHFLKYILFVSKQNYIRKLKIEICLLVRP